MNQKGLSGRDSHMHISCLGGVTRQVRFRLQKSGLQGCVCVCVCVRGRSGGERGLGAARWTAFGWGLRCAGGCTRASWLVGAPQCTRADPRGFAALHSHTSKHSHHLDVFFKQIINDCDPSAPLHAVTQAHPAAYIVVLLARALAKLN